MKVADLELFIRIAHSGNITSAAAELNLSPATASAAIKRLEQQLAKELFIRSTRKLRLSEAGERFLPFCSEALEKLKEGEQALQDESTELSGPLRISVSSDLGRNLLLPWLDEFLIQHPKLQINLNVSDSLSDFYHDRVDIALRYGAPQDSSLVAFPICDVDRILCAAPSYLAQAPVLEQPSQLSEHNCLLYLLADRTYDLWPFKQGDSVEKIKVRGNRICDDADLVRRWAVAGKGIAFKSQLDLANDLKAGHVIELLPEFRAAPIQLWLVCPSRKQVNPAVTQVRDYLRSRCQQLLDSLNTPHS